jgi:hypothetical protein
MELVAFDLKLLNLGIQCGARGIICHLLIGHVQTKLKMGNCILMGKIRND